jgi:hypothetical protein
MVDQIESFAVNNQIVVATHRVRSRFLHHPVVRRKSLLRVAFLIRLPMNPPTDSNTAMVRWGEKSMTGLWNL